MDRLRELGAEDFEFLAFDPVLRQWFVDYAQRLFDPIGRAQDQAAGIDPQARTEYSRLLELVHSSDIQVAAQILQGRLEALEEERQERHRAYFSPAWGTYGGERTDDRQENARRSRKFTDMQATVAERSARLFAFLRTPALLPAEPDLAWLSPENQITAEDDELTRYMKVMCAFAGLQGCIYDQAADIGAGPRTSALVGFHSALFEQDCIRLLLSRLQQSGRLDLLPEDPNAAYVLDRLEIDKGDTVVVLIDGREGRPKIGQAIEQSAQRRGVLVSVINLDEFFPADVFGLEPQAKQKYMRSQLFKRGMSSLAARLRGIRPNKSYLASDRPERLLIMERLLGCLPFKRSRTGLATLHGHDPELSWDRFQDYQHIDLAPIDARAEQVREIMEAGSFSVSSELGTDLHITLDQENYPILSGTGRVGTMAREFYQGRKPGGFWTNLRGGEVYTYPPRVEGTAVCIFRHQYWSKMLNEFEDLTDVVRIAFTIGHAQGDASQFLGYSCITDIQVCQHDDAPSDRVPVADERMKALATKLRRLLEIGKQPPSPLSAIGEIGIGLVEGQIAYDTVHDEKLWMTFHLALGGDPDDKSTARARAKRRFPYPLDKKTMFHVDIIMPGTIKRPA